MARLIAFVDCDPTGLTPHYRASLVLDGATVDGGWWRTEDKAVERLIEAVTPRLIEPIADAVVRVPRYIDGLDPRVRIVSEPNADEVPIGAVISRDPIARRCVRCGHWECPCCTNWCDACGGLAEEDFTRDGDWWVHKDNTAWRIHAACEAETACVFPDDPITAAARAEFGTVLHAVSRARWPHGGAFGVTDDGREWSGPPTFQSEAWELSSDDERAIKRAAAIVVHNAMGRIEHLGTVRCDVTILQSLLRLAGAATGQDAVAGNPLAIDEVIRRARTCELDWIIGRVATVPDYDPDQAHHLDTLLATLRERRDAVNKDPSAAVSPDDAAP